MNLDCLVQLLRVAFKTDILPNEAVFHNLLSYDYLLTSLNIITHRHKQFPGTILRQ